tara:strand:+ start:6012 stop:7133 length:1122 start_codon:yes stop_codon:yes gene_type:complete
MKIAVLTYNFNNNYGGMLQAYAMLKTLKKLGHEPELLLVPSINLSKKARLKKFIKKHFLSYLSSRWRDNSQKTIIEKNTKYFIEKYITPKTNPISTKQHFSKITKNNYNAYLVGSDQVWRAKVYRYIDYAFFGFVKSDEPILMSYAASFGVDTWDFNEEQTSRFKKQIQRFKGVAVREDSGVALCKEYFNTDAVHVLDPTMLLDPDDYREIIEQENEPNHSGSLLTYILDLNEDKQSIIDRASKELDFKPFKVNLKPKEEMNTLEDMVYPTVTAWLKGFDNAEYVITDSFHGCAFAILFNKPFIAYGNKARGMARFNSLLKMFGLQDRLVASKEEASIEKIKEIIDWNSVNSKLLEYRNISQNFLVETLKSKK